MEPLLRETSNPPRVVGNVLWTADYQIAFWLAYSLCNQPVIGVQRELAALSAYVVGGGVHANTCKFRTATIWPFSRIAVGPVSGLTTSGRCARCATIVDVM